MDGYHLNTPHDADASPFDPSGTDLTSTEVGPAIRELATNSAVSASPGFTWGKSGGVKNAYLLNDTVPSNKAGRIVPVNGKVTTVFVSAKNASTGTIELRKLVGASWIVIATVSLSGGRKVTELLASPPSVVKNDELAVSIGGITIDSPVVGIIIKGTL